MKKFLVTVSYSIFPLWIGIISVICYYNFNILPNISGDLGILGKIPFTLYYPERTIDSTYSNIKYKNVISPQELIHKKSLVLTVGDSFSQQGTNGYQNYISLRSNYHVTNYGPKGVHTLSPIQIAYDLVNLGYIDSTNVKTIIVQTVERALVSRLKFIKFDDKEVPKVTYMTSPKEKRWSVLEGRNFLYSKLGINKTVYHFQLKENLFSGKRPNELYIYIDDLNHISIKEYEQDSIRNNYLRFKSKIESKGIKLIFLICPDKYTIYQNFIKNNHKQKTIDEDFKYIMQNDSNIIFAKDLIEPQVIKGNKDMYLFDDTHWSYKSAALTANEIIKKLESYRE